MVGLSVAMIRVVDFVVPCAMTAGSLMVVAGNKMASGCSEG